MRFPLSILTGEGNFFQKTGKCTYILKSGELVRMLSDKYGLNVALDDPQHPIQCISIPKMNAETIVTSPLAGK